MLMGWLGPRQLAASALGINLTWPLRVRGLRDHHRRRSDDGHRAGGEDPFRPRCPPHVPAVSVALRLRHGPALAPAVECRAGHAFARPGARPRARRETCSCAAICGPCSRGCCSRRCAISLPRWSGRAGSSAISAVGVVANALLGWALIFGHLGLPELGIFGGGLASSIVWSLIAICRLRHDRH